MYDLMLCILAVAVGCLGAWGVAHHHEHRLSGGGRL